MKLGENAVTLCIYGCRRKIFCRSENNWGKFSHSHAYFLQQFELFYITSVDTNVPSNQPSKI